MENMAVLEQENEQLKAELAAHDDQICHLKSDIEQLEQALILSRA